MRRAPSRKTSNEQRVTSLAQTRAFVRRLAATLHGGNVLGLVGPLGAGKTTVVQMLAKELGVLQRPRSPSYTLLQPYTLPREIRDISTLVHVDAYRVSGPELLDAGLAEYLTDPHALIVVEWADQVLNLLPPHTITLALTPGRKPSERIATLTR
jgi:tRNA threonylcarbamoyladenosine biosynthesis protein TsaE